MQSGIRGLLATYLGPQRGCIVGLVALLLGGLALDLAGPQFIRAFIDSAVARGPLLTLLVIGGAFLVTALIRQALAIWETFVAENVSWTATNRLRTDLARHCLNLDRAFHQQHTPGELIERIDGDVTTLGSFFARLFIQLATNVLLLVGIAILCFGIDWRVGVVVLLCNGAALGVAFAMRNVGVKPWAAERQASADLYGFIEERLSGTEDVRSSGAVAHTLRQLALRSRTLLRRQRRAGIIGSATFNTLLIMLAVGTAAGLGVGAWLFTQHLITIGAVFLIYSYTDLATQPIEQMTRQLQEVQEALASVGRVQQLLAITSPLVDGPGAAFPPGALAVTCDHVDFGYSDGEGAVLSDISFALSAGAKLGIVGRTGSGKTTLARLLFRIIDPTGGSVQLGGIDLRAARLAETRERIGLVTQDIQLFHASVRDNLTFFDATIADDQIHAILTELGMDRWLATLPQGLDTVLASDGAGLSAGEAQLLAFARVFLRDPGLVILDEASSRLDLATEQTVEHAIERLLMGRTGIIIAHRLATLQRVDVILLLEDGRIAEYGSRDQLARDPHSRFAQLLQVGLMETLA